MDRPEAALQQLPVIVAQLARVQRRAAVIVADGGTGLLEQHEAERGGGFIAASGLREQDSRERVHERQVAAIAGRVEGGGGLGQMLTDDARFTDLLVAEGEFVVGQTDGTRVVREFGVLERAGVQRDRP